jgi:hypothetical protein
MTFGKLRRTLASLTTAGLLTVLPASAATLFVAPGGTGNGSAANPFGRVAHALAVAAAGDEVVLRPGTYGEAVRTVRGGSVDRPLVIRAEEPGTAILSTAAGTVLRISHPFVSVQGVIVDGQYAPFDAVIVDSTAEGWHFQGSEVRRTSRDCIDIRAPGGVLIEGALIHHCLWSTANGQFDAHGIVAGAVRDLTIRDTRIHTFSGDAVQVDSGRSAPGWNRVTIERCQFWVEPLPAPVNGFPAGAVPGENAVDTKSSGAFARATLIVRDTEAWGFRGGFITNMAAFNIKENVDATLDGVTASRSEIAFRLRGPGPNGGAWVRVQNAVVFDVETGVRYEDNIERVEVWNSTFGSDVARIFRAASSNASGLDVKNVLFMGATVSELSGASNMAAAATFFVDAASHDYRLLPNSLAIDSGISLTAVTTDRAGGARPAGRSWDVGAHEYTPQPDVAVPPANTRRN